MALNQLMHPRSPYRRKPDFKALAIKYPEFRKHVTQDLKGKVHLDFKSPECLSALSWVLLKNDWDLDVILPTDRLIPTIPLRLNYILWLEDLLGDEKDVTGIDIGAGASCVYALIGAKKNEWKFVASEVDPDNYSYAKQNIERNNLSDKISVFKVEPGARLKDVLALTEGKNFSFCMCNPPFFTNNLEAWGTYTNRKEDRPDPNSVCTATQSESIVSGGEVDFVKKMIDDSLTARSRVRIYTTMLGKKTSVPLIREKLLKHKINNFGVTEFCQGRTMRWGLGWTFDPGVKFPERPSKTKMGSKPKTPILYRCPPTIAEEPGVKYDVLSIGRKIIHFLDELKTVYEIEKSSTDTLEVLVVAQQNTWSHSRRKRRQEMQALGLSKKGKDDVPQKESSDITSSDAAPASLQTERNASGDMKSVTGTDVSQPGEEDPNQLPLTDAKSDSDTRGKEVSPVAGPSLEEMERLNKSVDDVEEYLLKFSLALKKDGEHIDLSLTWQNGQSIELLHQVMQFFKNRLK